MEPPPIPMPIPNDMKIVDVQNVCAELADKLELPLEMFASACRDKQLDKHVLETLELAVSEYCQISDTGWRYRASHWILKHQGDLQRAAGENSQLPSAVTQTEARPINVPDTSETLQKPSSPPKDKVRGSRLLRTLENYGQHDLSQKPKSPPNPQTILLAMMEKLEEDTAEFVTTSNQVYQDASANNINHQQQIETFLKHLKDDEKAFNAQYGVFYQSLSSVEAELKGFLSDKDKVVAVDKRITELVKSSMRSIKDARRTTYVKMEARDQSPSSDGANFAYASST